MVWWRVRGDLKRGVWVIAETDNLPTTFRKIVVTDDRGRFVLPDLPRATYRVWVRGYGLVDSSPVESAPGRTLHLTAVPAPTPQAAAQIYPPNYWHSLLEAPPESEFPGTGEDGNGIPTHVESRSQWLYGVKVACKQLPSDGGPGDADAGASGRLRVERRRLGKRVCVSANVRK